MSDEPEVIQGNVLQVRIQAVDYPSKGIFKVIPEREVEAFFDRSTPGWVNHGVQTTLVGSGVTGEYAFQILTHHWVTVDGTVEAWYVTVHPGF